MSPNNKKKLLILRKKLDNKLQIYYEESKDQNKIRKAINKCTDSLK